MSEVGNQGRTVLVVSHNMQAIAQLTKRSIVMDKGQCVFDGATDEAINAYNKLRREDTGAGYNYRAESADNSHYLAWATVHTSAGRGRRKWGQPITFEFGVRVRSPKRSLCFSFQVMNNLQRPVCRFLLFGGDLAYRKREGLLILSCNTAKFGLYMVDYTLGAWV